MNPDIPISWESQVGRKDTSVASPGDTLSPSQNSVYLLSHMSSRGPQGGRDEDSPEISLRAYIPGKGNQILYKMQQGRHNLWGLWTKR